MYDFVIGNLDYDHTFKKSWVGAKKALKNGTGVCSDYSDLFVAISRAKGIPARYVSGYTIQNGISDSGHAWVEVYLPGAGWRGYDPTLGLVVGDRHIPLAASAIPSYAAAVEGTVTPIKPGIHLTSELKTQIIIDFLES